MDIRCQQFTSHDIANNMLEMANYSDDLYGKKVLENSCGEGNILSLIVEKYIKDALNKGYNIEEIAYGLENDIYGAEIVKETYDKCINNLNNIALKYGIKNIRWSIVNEDILKKPFKIMFDYVIGNPPYISYRNLELKDRKYIKENYNTCINGKPDYCYAFIENAIDYLKTGGTMAYLIPNSIFKNVFAKELRTKIMPHLVKVFDYPNRKLFENALTSSAIMLINKGSNSPQFVYYNVVLDNVTSINKSLLGNKWIFNIDESSNDEEVAFEEYFKASITIATQRNKVFVIDENIKEQAKIERGILRKAISPRNQTYGYDEYIIFPYKLRNGKIVHYDENEFRTKYPNAYNYLQKNKQELDARAADKNALWFEYGRSQAVHNMNKKKLLVSTVVTNKIEVYDVSDKSIPYSGIYIVSDNGYDLQIAKKILQSKRFMEYVKGIGTPASGNSLRITADDINQFTFKVGDFIDE